VLLGSENHVAKRLYKSLELSMKNVAEDADESAVIALNHAMWARRETGWTIADLARATGLKPSTIFRLSNEAARHVAAGAYL
jgi:DNA-binding IclR family transcriptional regulator